MRASVLTRLLLILAVSLGTPGFLLAQADSSFSPLPVFEFHSGFWLNLHHTLYHQARAQRTPGATSIPPMTNLSPAEQKAWDAAVGYYAEAYATKDLLFSLEMILIKNQLGDFETCDDLSGLKKRTCDAGLPKRLTDALSTAAPVYRAHLWQEHDRANRRWIASVAPLVRRSGVNLSHRLAEIYQTDWPKERIRVDVTAYSNSSGAYTTLDPLRVTVSSTDARNQGPEALEILFHEASHGISDNVQDAILRECRQRDKPVPRDLWHALLFYTTGEVIRPTVFSSDASTVKAGYVPYAVREGLYKRGWEDYLRVLTDFWQPYLDGKESFDDAIAHMVSAL
ncbi:MAG TPA: hypothetical protein VN025_16600 [Candidatus Dormibacteraeota bacterium]|jgi:hypothetical protein|nr:hypothetical protein [Candidatus Dormibacteraeota bacterium]